MNEPKIKPVPGIVEEPKLIPAPDPLKNELRALSAQLQQASDAIRLRAENAILRAWIDLGLSKDYEWDDRQQGWVAKK